MTGFFLSNHIKILVQQEACDWTGKREAELKFAEMGSVSREKKPRQRQMDRKNDLNLRGFK